MSVAAFKWLATPITPATISDTFLQGADQIVFSNSQDINNFWQSQTHFIDWFNANCAKKDNWAINENGKKVKISIGASQTTKTNFATIWDQIPIIFAADPNAPSQITMMQFLALMSIIVNETGGTLSPLTERIQNVKDHPGISYFFDRIRETRKRSYNNPFPPDPKHPPKNPPDPKSLPQQTAFDCFHNADFNNAHQSKPLGADLANKATAIDDVDEDRGWSGSKYPDGVSTSDNPSETGYVLEADFFKFRGRGYIQNTFRASYKSLIKFIQDYKGSNSKVLEFTNKWSGQDPDTVAYTSSTIEWDDLFQHSQAIVPCMGIRLHNRGGRNYLNLSATESEINGKGNGSIWNVGLKISGGKNYADLYYKRVVQLCNALGNPDQPTL